MAIAPVVDENNSGANKGLAGLISQVTYTAEQKAKALKELNDVKKRLNDWVNWKKSIQQLLLDGFNYDNNTDGTPDSFEARSGPYEPFQVNLTQSKLNSWVTRGVAKIESFNSAVTAATNKLNKANADYKKAFNKLQEFVGRPISAIIDGQVIFEQNTDEGRLRNRESITGGNVTDDGDSSSSPITPTVGTQTVLKNKDAKRVKIQFNIPMVKSAYFPNKGIQDDVISEKVNSWSNSVNGRKMWLGDAGGKGVIQPNLAVAATQLSKTYTDSKAIVKDLNNKLFGFKFLYNPSSISMEWGIAQEVDPTTIGLGLDKGIPLTGNLSPSSISFELILNRVEDMNHLEAKGWKRALINPGFFDEVTRTGVYPTYSNENPWPTPSVPNFEDLQEIYERGTMYDIDFLFSALMPGAPKYRSNLNGILADRGYMSGYTCELHLGPRMRYNVQIGKLEIDHIMFNERMVPTLSKARILATRLPDVRQGIVKGYGINTKDYSTDKGN
jgi:hypothetical protein